MARLLLSFDPGFQSPPGVSPEQVRAARKDDRRDRPQFGYAAVAGDPSSCTSTAPTAKTITTRRYSLRPGKLLAQYHKMHPVMFGEYVPLADKFPFLYHLMPLPGGLTPARPVSQEIHGVRYSPIFALKHACRT